jgi:farnesyl-diphosphate farnesyltransferase
LLTLQTNRYQQVIAEITRLMGEGMAEYSTKAVETVHDYDLYCHYVAGLVGIGLSRIFAYSELEGDCFMLGELAFTFVA